MIINWSPVRSDEELKITKKGDKLTINGEVFDFSVIPDGATLPATAVNCEFVIGDVERKDGELVLTLILPHAVDASEAARFPKPAKPKDGKVEIPV